MQTINMIWKKLLIDSKSNFWKADMLFIINKKIPEQKPRDW